MNYRERVSEYTEELKKQERASATVGKYRHDIEVFYRWLCERELTKSEVIAYKGDLSTKYEPTSVNSMLSSLNGFFDYIGRYDLKVKALKLQKRTFMREDRILSKQEYERLIEAAKKKKNKRLYYLMQTVCASGIRVSEIRFITVEALKIGYADIRNKGKRRRVFLTKELCAMLKKYCAEREIKKGSIFISRSGKALDRSNIWHEMKALCKKAGVAAKKVFPHNLRHLFARTFYAIKKDIAHLADILGHESINTTRIYTSDDGSSCKQQLAKLGLLRC